MSLSLSERVMGIRATAIGPLGLGAANGLRGGLRLLHDVAGLAQGTSDPPQKPGTDLGSDFFGRA
jgi:hypothetical protein